MYSIIISLLQVQTKMKGVFDQKGNGDAGMPRPLASICQEIIDSSFFLHAPLTIYYFNFKTQLPYKLRLHKLTSYSGSTD